MLTSPRRLSLHAMEDDNSMFILPASAAVVRSSKDCSTRQLTFKPTWGGVPDVPRRSLFTFKLIAAPFALWWGKTELAAGRKNTKNPGQGAVLGVLDGSSKITACSLTASEHSNRPTRSSSFKISTTILNGYFRPFVRRVCRPTSISTMKTLIIP